MEHEFPEMHELAAFVRVVDLDSFSAAATEFGVSQPTVSKWIAELERRLGTTLLSRTTRSRSLTEAGRIYYQYCRRILATAEAADGHLRSLHGTPSGTLRVSIPMSFGQLHVVPRLPAFLATHPHVELDLELSDRRVDIVREGFDLAIRIGNLPDSSLRSVRLGATRRVVVGTPAHFDAHGRPEEPEQLAQHDCLRYTGGSDPHAWRFRRDGETFVVRVGGRFGANNGQAVREAVLAGLGVAMLPTWLVDRDVERGALQEVLGDYTTPELDMRAVYPATERVPPKTVAFIDFLGEAFSPVCTTSPA